MFAKKVGSVTPATKRITREGIFNPFWEEFEIHPQQEDIVLAVQDNDTIIIDSIAGSSKTISQVIIAHNYPTPSLYLTFSKALAEEAKSVFPDYVDCRTIHSLAYREVGRSIAHKLSRPRGRYINVAGTGSEIAKYYKIKTFCIEGSDVEIKNTLIGLMIKQTVDKYEASADDNISKDHLPYALIKVSKNKVKDLHDKEVKKIFNSLSSTILKYARVLWKDRQNPDSKVLGTHDTYVKLWALTKPTINTGILYLDELQDANAVFMGVVKDQTNCKKVLVGDPDQNLYAWRYSVNGLAMVNGKQMTLDQSFRYGQASANLAMQILGNGRAMKGFPIMDTKVGGKGTVDTSKPYVKLFRMNATLLQEALDLLSEGEKVNIHVDVKDYVKMLESADALYSGKPHKVKHEDILPFDSWEELKEEAKVSGILQRVSHTVSKGELYSTIYYLKSHKNTDNPDVSLMTAHRSKGCTFDNVIVADDFESNYDKKGNWVGIDDAEKRLLYVAVTRAKLSTQYNSTIEEIINKGQDLFSEGIGLSVSQDIEIFDITNGDGYK